MLIKLNQNSNIIITNSTSYHRYKEIILITGAAGGGIMASSNARLNGGKEKGINLFLPQMAQGLCSHLDPVQIRSQILWVSHPHDLPVTVVSLKPRFRIHGMRNAACESECACDITVTVGYATLRYS